MRVAVWCPARIDNSRVPAAHTPGINLNNNSSTKIGTMNPATIAVEMNVNFLIEFVLMMFCTAPYGWPIQFIVRQECVSF